MDEAPEALLRLLEEERLRPLADVRRSSGQTGQQFSDASSEAADNLLTKAVRRLVAGDPVAARGFVGRALALPYREEAERQPAIWSAHMMLFAAIGTDMRTAGLGSPSWLDRTEDLMGNVAPVAAHEIRICLASFTSDVYDLSPPVRERVKQLAGEVALNTDAFDGTAPERGAQALAILDVLDAVIKHRALSTV